jgi:methionyl-tRNA formyltransferase
MKILYLTNTNAENINELPNFMRTYGDEVDIYFNKINKEYFAEKKIDFIVSDRYQFLIKQDVIDIMQGKIINLHPSYLPWNKGYHSNFWSIYDKTTKGVSIHYVDEGIDTGDIAIQKKVSFNEKDTLKTTYQKLRVSIVELFFYNWIDIKNNNTQRIKQISEGSIHYKKELDALFQKLPKGWDTKVFEIEQRKYF